MHANQSDAGRAITLMSESSAIRGADFNASVINEPVKKKWIDRRNNRKTWDRSG